MKRPQNNHECIHHMRPARPARPVKPARPARQRRRTLLPVLRPYFNAREVVKQMAMLEDHLNNRHKRCTDCINKHFLTIEGLAEELGSLCRKGDGQDRCDDLPSKVRVLHHAWSLGKGRESVAIGVAGELRKLRKRLMGPYATLPVQKLPSEETTAVRAFLKRCSTTSSSKCARKRMD